LAFPPKQFMLKLAIIKSKLLNFYLHTHTDTHGFEEIKVKQKNIGE